MSTTKKQKRYSVASTVRATHVYPELGSSRSATATLVNIVLKDDEALNLARHLVQAARESRELTIAAVRKPGTKNNLHTVTVTYEARMKK